MGVRIRGGGPFSYGLAQVEIGSLFGFLKESIEGNSVKIKKNYIDLGCGAPPHLRGKMVLISTILYQI